MNAITKDKVNNSKVLELNYYITNNTIYYVDGKNVILNYSEKEYEIAIWLSKLFKCIVFICPKVNYPKNIKTADYLIINEYWDLKCINGSGTRNIDNKIKECKNQSQNFIIDNSKQLITNNEAIKQIRKIYCDSKRQWVKKIILVENNKLIKFFKRN